jgi:hypothetical protein
MKISSVMLLATLFVPEPAGTLDKGEFVGRVAVEWISEPGPDRQMQLLEDFGYRDPAGKLWNVPAGTTIDGASIPQVFWSAVGSPFTGDYRRASVVHDHYCRLRTERWQAVHRMFYDAMVAGGVALGEARVLYAAVYGGGPRWRWESLAGLQGGTNILVDMTPDFEREQFDSVAAWIADTDPSLEAIEQHVDSVVAD